MRISILTFGAVASIIAINSVFADTTSTVTSRGYVDAAVATKQNKIGATGANFTNGSVVETTGTEGVVTQRGIFNPETDTETGPFGDVHVASGHEGDLVTAGSVLEPLTYASQAADDYWGHVHPIDNECIEYVANAEHTDANCLLWQLANKTDTPVQRCQTNADCGNPEGNRCGILCVSGMCQPQNC